MDKIASAQSAPQDADEYQFLIEQLLSEMKDLNRQMAFDRADIDRLKAESGALKAETRALLAGMGAQF